MHDDAELGITLAWTFVCGQAPAWVVRALV
jgi:hypothetical protein